MNEFFAYILVFGAVVAWFTHLFFCFSQAAWGFLIAGAIFFPIGIFHGIYIWLT